MKQFPLSCLVAGFLFSSMAWAQTAHESGIGLTPPEDAEVLPNDSLDIQGNQAGQPATEQVFDPAVDTTISAPIDETQATDTLEITVPTEAPGPETLDEPLSDDTTVATPVEDIPGVVEVQSLEEIVLVPGDADRGLALSETCAACHGVDGNGPIPEYPKLAGQHEDYLVYTMMEYRQGPEGGRNNPVMYGLLAGFSDQDILDLAAYYAEQEITFEEADPEWVELGERIYRGGNIEAYVAACIACHGPQGEGNYLANFPRVGGQHAEYIADQLRQFRSGERGGGINDMMAQVVDRMSEDEIDAVSSYISGLH